MFGSLSPTLETWIGFLAPSCDLAHAQPVVGIWENEPVDECTLSLSKVKTKPKETNQLPGA